MTSAIVSVSEPGTTELRGDRESEETELRELRQQLQRELAGLAPLLGVRHDAAAREVAHGALHRELIVAVVEPH
jgi:hypothetical protein